MSYCQECGSHFEKDMTTCNSCGGVLTVVQEMEAASSNIEDCGEIGSEMIDDKGDDGETNYSVLHQEMNPEPSEIMEDVVEIKKNPIHDNPGMEQWMGFQRNKVETHLGKGLVKPVVVENCMDGIHFKYDEPPCKAIKSEPQKEKIVEFRVSGEPELMTEPEESESIVTEPTELVEVELGEDSLPEFEGESSMGSEASVIDEFDKSNESEEIEETYSEELSSLVEEVLPDLGSVEPEKEMVGQPEVLWEGHRTWYGLSLKEKYLITDRTVSLLGEDGCKIIEIDWDLISGVSLKQSWLSRLLGRGDLELFGRQDELIMVLTGIKQPDQLQKKLVDLIKSKV